MIGTLSVLGDSLRRVALELALEASLLGLGSALVSTLVVQSTLPIAAKVVSGIVGIAVNPQLAGTQIGLTLVAGALLGFLLALPFASRIRRLKPSALFQEEANLDLPFAKRDVWAVLPLILVFYALSVYQSHSWRVGSVFFGLTALSVLGLYFVGSLVFRSAERLSTARNFGTLPFRLAVRSLSRNPWSSLSAFVATGVGAILLSLIPSLQTAMIREIERPEGSKVPSLFLFDIQEEQLPKLREVVAEGGATLDYLSPLVRARLETINGKPAVKAKDLAERSTREQEEEDRSRNRGYNLSYREGLSDSEKISSGRGFEGRFDPASGGLPEVTVERKFADRLGVGVGYRIGFEIEGVPIEAKVVGLRTVRWSSFQPNFFIVFQPGAIDDAPKTFLGGIPSLPEAKRRALQEKVVATFPNVSVIQVDELVRKISRIFDQMGTAVQITGLLSLVTGLFVIFAIARRQAVVRRRNALLLKTVGASAGDVIGIFLWEFGLLSFTAALLGGALSFALSRLIVWIVFERRELALGLAEAQSFGLSLVGITGISLFCAAIAAWGIARAKPWKLLQAED
jgi:putative ABC transport system permease protein